MAAFIPYTEQGREAAAERFCVLAQRYYCREGSGSPSIS